MNELAETNRNIGLLETSISLQPFSAVAMETQADAAEMMIAEETGRKRQILNHLRELSEECLERRNEIAALRNSAIQEAMTYARVAAKFQAANNQESYEEALKMRNKARKEYDDYSVAAEQLANLSTEINNTLAGETLPRLLPLTTIEDLPFESAKPAENILDTFERLVKAHPQQVIDYIADHRMVSDTVDAAICEITGGRVNVEDVMQSFDEVLQDEYAGFYEALNTAYAGNEATFRQELAACVEAYA